MITKLWALVALAPTIVALTPTYICQEHLLTNSGRRRAVKALSAPLLNPGATVRWLQFLRTNNLAQRLAHGSPNFLVKPVTKYLNTNYEFADRVRALVSHYEFISRQFTETDLESIYFADGVKLAEFLGNSGASYQVILSTYSATHNEGELVVKIVTSNADVVCFAIFTVGSSANGKPRIEVGAIQGARRQNPGVSKIATKDFHSMRPHHLLMAIFYSFARHCNIHSIVCVNTRCQVGVLNPSFRTHYDPFWEELGGQCDTSGFYALPAELSHSEGPKPRNKHPIRHRRRTELKTVIGEMIQSSLATRNYKEWRQVDRRDA